MTFYLTYSTTDIWLWYTVKRTLNHIITDYRFYRMFYCALIFVRVTFGGHLVLIFQTNNESVESLFLIEYYFSFLSIFEFI